MDYKSIAFYLYYLVSHFYDSNSQIQWILQFSPYEFPENLLETLDISDVAEMVPPTEDSALKLKNIVGEGADASSSTQHPPSLN